MNSSWSICMPLTSIHYLYPKLDMFIQFCIHVVWNRIEVKGQKNETPLGCDSLYGNVMLSILIYRYVGFDTKQSSHDISKEVIYKTPYLVSFLFPYIDHHCKECTPNFDDSSTCFIDYSIWIMIPSPSNGIHLEWWKPSLIQLTRYGSKTHKLPHLCLCRQLSSGVKVLFWPPIHLVSYVVR